MPNINHGSHALVTPAAGHSVKPVSIAGYQSHFPRLGATDQTTDTLIVAPFIKKNFLNAVGILAYATRHRMKTENQACSGHVRIPLKAKNGRIATWTSNTDAARFDGLGNMFLRNRVCCNKIKILGDIHESCVITAQSGSITHHSAFRIIAPVWLF
jgi:hypothetical protein